MPLRDLLINGGLILAGAYVLAALVLIVFARTLIYSFQPGFSAMEPTGVPGAEAVTFAAADGTELIAWVVPPEAGKPVVLYFMGNAGSLPSHAPLLAELARHGMGLAALNYRGAGGAPGNPSQEKLISDGLTLYDRLGEILGEDVPPERRVIYGTSLGAALAVQVAARRPSAAVVLEAPFKRLCEVAGYHYPIFPVCLVLPYERWNSSGLIHKIAAPLLILHGEADEVVPFSQGKALYGEAEEPKRLISYPGIGHNDLYEAGTAEDAARFIEEVTGG